MELLSIREAAKIRNVTKQAVYLAIREGRLKPFMRGKVMKVSMAAIMELEKKKYERVVKLFQGEEVFSDKNGVISVAKAAKLTGMPRTSLYNAIYSGRLNAERKGHSWVLRVRDLTTIQTYYLNRKPHKKYERAPKKNETKTKDLSK